MTVMPSQYRMMRGALAFAQQNHQVISQNLANVNSPGYQTREISFQDYLKVMDGDAAKQNDLPIVAVEGLRNRADGNNVQMDLEIAKLGRNSLLFQTYSQILASKMATMRHAISSS